jgi:hypothetical protein
MVRKVVLSDNLIGALVDVEEFDHCTSRRVTVSTRGQPGDTARRFTTEWQKPADCFILDIALFKGKLYILTTQVQHYQRDLHVLDDGRQGHTAIRSVRRVRNILTVPGYNPYSTDNYVERSYLVVSGDRLLLVERGINQPPMLPRDNGIKKRTRRFQVFEAADLSGGRGRWMKVDTLMGHALFVSEGCSESLPAMGQCGDVGIREDCIYFINEADTFTSINPKILENPMLDSGVYNMRERTVIPLLKTATAQQVTVRGLRLGFFPET